MNFQEKYDEYKQRREAKKFFNQNNDYHLSISDYIKMFVVGTVIAIFSTIAFDCGKDAASQHFCVRENSIQRSGWR